LFSNLLKSVVSSDFIFNLVISIRIFAVHTFTELITVKSSEFTFTIIFSTSTFSTWTKNMVELLQILSEILTVIICDILLLFLVCAITTALFVQLPVEFRFDWSCNFLRIFNVLLFDLVLFLLVFTLMLRF